MPADRVRLRRRLDGLVRTGPSEPARRDEILARIGADIDASIQRLAARRERLPVPAFPEDLPVSARREDIARAIETNQVVVVCGETGSGKTTQLPKICLAIGRGATGAIGMTQPRRIAARSVAGRIAEELGTALGRDVGFKVRFTDRTSPDSFIKVMTDGVLLAETQGDRSLEQYDTIIVDEAHERSLNIDFLLGYLKQLLPRRPELKVIVTSATIDPERFSEHFGGAPIVEVSGRTYPVETRYRPVEIDPAADPYEHDSAVQAAILDAVDELASIDPRGGGDVLVFLAGEREIRETAEALRKRHPPRVEILPLYARLSTAEQQRVFQPHAGRRIVLATNVAETSLTVPGIRYVVDPGYARISRYSARTRVQRLPIEAVSRASADQRKGRCGRLEAGVCMRLYSEQDYEARPRFTEPEILRTNLAAVILQMKALRLGAVESFPFVEPPDGRMIRDGYDTLHELGAVDEQGELTAIGRDLAKLPIDPRIGRMILAAERENCVTEVLVIASALSVQDPRERPMDAQDKADAAHAELRDEQSDFLTYLKVWRFFHEQKEHLSQSKLRKLCREKFLSFVRMREWVDIHQQLQALVTGMGHKANEAPADYAAIHRALLAGLLTNVAAARENHEYEGVRSNKMFIFPGSALFKKSPKWLMAAEIVRTTRLYARTVARIDPLWIESVGHHLLKRAHADPHWVPEQGQACVFERVTLHGLEVFARKRVPYGPIEPRAARDLFIHHALVDGDLKTDGAFAAHNATLVREIRALEAKVRRSDLLADPEAVHAFFDERIPQDVYSARAFERWRRRIEKSKPRLLHMTRDDLARPAARSITPADFPDSLDADGLSLPLSYRYEPGHPADGATVTCPVEALLALRPERMEWLVPGMVRDKVEAFIRALPKDYRRLFVPAPDFAARVAAELPFGERSFEDAVGARLDAIAGERLPRSAWRAQDAIPEHLRMRIRVVDHEGRELAAGRDLADIRRGLREHVERAFDRIAGAQYSRDHLTTWEFGDLPESVEFARAGLTLRGYPAIVDMGGDVSLRLFRSRAAAADATRRGLRRLFLIQFAGELAFEVDSIPELQSLTLRFATLGGGKELKADLAALIADRAFLPDGGVGVRSRAQFDARLTEGWNRITDATRQARTLVGQILDAHHAATLRLPDRPPVAWMDALDDVRSQLDHLAPRGFLSSTPWERLVHVPRYLKAIDLRLQKLQTSGAGRDQRQAAQVVPYWRACLQQMDLHRAEGVHDPAIVELRWLVEEFRVSLFAQELGTAAPVSPQRMEKAWAAVRG